MRKQIDTGRLIDLNTTDLPEFIINKIDREELEDIVERFNEMSKYEGLVNEKKCI